MVITKDIIYAGVDDHQVDLFEGQFTVPLGMAYNSYVILDEKTAVMDTVDGKFTQVWLNNLKEILGDKTPDYLVIHHMEPDHSASIQAFTEVYPETVLVGNAQTFKFMDQFYPGLQNTKRQIVTNNGTLELGTHTLTFVFAPMVHWPEVMMSYDSQDKVLFSADAFGKFGANDVEDPEGWDCEARRYYFGIVGKYGPQVQAVLKKAQALDIQIICSLHGPVLTENIAYYVDKYNTWSSYEAEDEGVFIAYASIYGHTKETAEKLAAILEEKGIEYKISDLAREDIYECVENGFRYSKLVLASVTYNTEVFPVMKQYIELLKERNYQKRTVAFIENGTWAPMAAKTMQNLLSTCKELTFVEPVVTIRSSLNDDTPIRELAEKLG
ncbi:MAG: FprA family A-type flavoprotein [Solobacterium sp.]|nr:FprA family A-type flavoprotein [Solobacterium sp.]